MPLASETDSSQQAAPAQAPTRVPNPEFPYEVEMTFMEHLEELRRRLLASLIAVGLCIVACFLGVNRLVAFLEVPAQGVTFLQLAPGEYFFVSLKVAAYAGLLLATPFLLYQIVRFVLPGLSVKEIRLLGPAVLGSSLLFVAGLAFAYYLLIPAALNFFIRYGEGVVEQAWSIDRYFEFVLLLMFSTGLAFQVPILQALLGALGLVTAEQMLKGWRYVVVASVVAGAILTPSTDPLTQSLLAGAITFLYGLGVLLVKLLGR